MSANSMEKRVKTKMDINMDEKRVKTNMEINMDDIACSWLLHNHTLTGGFVEPW